MSGFRFWVFENDSLGIYQFDFHFVFQHFLGYQTEHDDICGVCMIIVLYFLWVYFSDLFVYFCLADK